MMIRTMIEPAAAFHILPDLPVQAFLTGSIYSSVTIHAKSIGYCLYFLRFGSADITYDQATYSLFPASYTVIPANTQISIEPKTTPCEVFCFYLSGSAADTAFQTFARNGNPFCIMSAESLISDILSRLIHFHPGFPSFDETMYLSLVDNLFSELSSSGQTDRRMNLLPPLYAVSMKQILDTRYYELLTLDILASELHMNKFKLAKEFKSYYGIAPIEYLIDKRIDVAKVLLVSSQKTVTQVGMDVSMENTPYFISLFKKRVGQTPLLYRKAAQRNYLPR